jgi:hypothetical protein
MDDLTLLRSFRAERDDGDPRARAAAWGELEAMFEPASTAPASPARSPRRGLLALAGAGTLAAVAVAALILSSGSATEPAAAEVLHQTAAVAASGEGAPALQAGSGQYYFMKTKELELKGWYPGSYEVPGAPTSRQGGFTALVPSESEWWLSPEGGSRTRTTLGKLRFLSGDEESRWEAAGSPLPSNFEPSRQAELGLGSESGVRLLESRPGVVDLEHLQSDGGASPGLYPDLSKAPTDPEALRAAVENREVAGYSEPGNPLDAQETIEDLTGLLSRPNASPALRAAAFNAVAEMAGVELDRSATDLVGRTGFAVSYDRGHGIRDEYIFDPRTSESLGERTVLVDPSGEPQWKGYEAGLTIRDVAFLESGVVDSTRERPDEQGTVATASEGRGD